MGSHRAKGKTWPQAYLQKDLVAVISKYVKINPEDIKVGLEKQGNFEVIEVNIVLPEIR